MFPNSRIELHFFMLSDAHLSFSIDPNKDLENVLSLKKNKEIIKTVQ